MFFFSPLRLVDVVVMLVLFTTMVAKLDRVDTCTSYEVDPATVDQFNVGVRDTLVAPFAGDRRDGAMRLIAAVVVKLLVADQVLVPALFDAFTLQKYVVPFVRPLRLTEVTVTEPLCENLGQVMLPPESSCIKKI